MRTIKLRLLAVVVSVTISMPFLSKAQVFKGNLDPQLKALYSKNLGANNTANKNARENTTASTVETRVNCLLEYTGSIQALKSIGVSVNSKIGKYFTTSFPLSILPQVSALEGMRIVELAKPVELKSDYVSPLFGDKNNYESSRYLDKSVDAIKAKLARQAFGVSGKGVVIGIIDTGVDHTVLDFKKADGTSRIKFYWDQHDDPSSFYPHPSGFDYGSEGTQEMLTNGFIPNDFNGHGTHIAGIAAGNGSQTGNGYPAGRYVGVAPEADIVVVELPKTYVSLSTQVLDAIKYVSDKAKILGEPWVVNLSLGSGYGPRNGTSMFEKAISEIASNPEYGKGRIIVASAGNDNYNSLQPYYGRFHSSEFGPGIMKVEVNSSVAKKDELVVIEIFCPKNSNYSLVLTAPDGKNYEAVKKDEWKEYNDYQNGHIFINSQSDGFPYPDSKEHVFTVYLNDLIRGGHEAELFVAPGTWKIALKEGTGKWDAYIAEKQIAKFSLDTYSNAQLVNEPGNVANVITIGSVITKNGYYGGNGQWWALPPGLNVGDVSVFSSQGSRAFYKKPDYYAPGEIICSSRAYHVIPKPNDIPYAVTGEPDGRHIHMSGTSMAAPHAAGAAALILEAQMNSGKDANVGDIKRILYAGQTNQNVIDCYASINSFYNPTGIEDKLIFNTCGAGTNPSIIQPGTDYTFCARFLDEAPTGDYALSFKWRLEIPYSSGIFIAADKTTSAGLNSSVSLNINNANLGDYTNYLRDANGNISGRIILSCYDNDSIYHEETWELGIKYKPNIPAILELTNNTTSVTIPFIAAGATSYKIHYGTTLGGPYNGTGATQGNSPISINSQNITLTGLNIEDNTYYFVIEAINSYGSSFSYENQTNPIIVTKEPLSSPLFCNNAILSIPFKASGFRNNTTFQARLSDPLGSFDTYTVIGSLAGKSSGTIQADISNVGVGTKYRIKVVSLSPTLEGISNIQDLSIKPFYTITTNNISSTSFCPTSQFNVSYNTSCAYSGKTFTFDVQLSNENGSFDNPKVIGSEIHGGNSTKSIVSLIPGNVVGGTGYRIRIICQELNIIGSVTTPFTIIASAIINTQPINKSTCEGVSAKFLVQASGTISQYLWQGKTSSGALFTVANESGSLYSGATTSELSVNNPDFNLNNYQYRCLIFSGSCNILTNWVTLSVTKNILTSNLPSTVCTGNNIAIPYTLTSCGTFNSGNVFTAQLSDLNGSFNNPVNIGSTASIASGTIIGIIPSTLLGSGYRIRVVSSNPLKYGQDNGANILIESPIVTQSLVSNSYCPGANASILFAINSCITYNSGNVFTAQLSNANGNFSNPVNIGSVTSVIPVSISATIPINTATGSNHRIRVISSNPAKIGTDNGTDININQAPNVTITSNTTEVSCTGSEQIIWANAVNCTINGNNISKTPGVASGWNAGASSLQAINNGGYVETTCNSGLGARVIGLSHDPTDVLNTKVQFGIVLAGSNLGIIESGVNKSTPPTTYVQGDKLKISVENSKVLYYKNNTLVYTSLTTPVFPLYADVSLQNQASSFSNVNLRIDGLIRAIGSATFTATTTNIGAIPVYTWKLNGNNAGTNSNTFTSTSLASTDKVSCVFTSSSTACYNGSPITSNVITMVCGSNLRSVSIFDTEGVHNLNDVNVETESEILIYPNPSSEVFNIVVPKIYNSTLLQLTDLNGKIWKQVRLTAEKQEISIKGLASGVYIINLIKGKSSIKRKLLVQ